MAVIYTPHFMQFFDSNGDPLAGGLLDTFSAGTVARKATYTTAAGDVENTNPVVLDSAGRAIIFLVGSYKFVLNDSLGTPIANGTTDNVTAFNATTESSEGFFNSFSGDGEELDFTLSESLGTDEKALMVFAEIEAVKNGNFDTDSGWTKGAGWSIGSGVATAAGAISTALSQTSTITIFEGKAYSVSYDLTRDAGDITLSLGGTAGETNNVTGTFSETIIAGSTQAISFGTSSFTGTLDNVTIREVGGLIIQSPSTYTVNGTALTFTVPPAIGVGNVYVYAPFTLVNAAGAAQSAADDAIAAQAGAELAETGAQTAETNAVAAAASVVGLDTTSTTSLAIGTGTKVFTVDASKGFLAGMYLIAVSDADVSNYMHGQVVSYAGTTLTMDITNIGGTGTLADWTISLSGTQGAKGDAGAISNIGSQPTATITAADKVIFADVTDSDASKNDTVQGILDLIPPEAAGFGKLWYTDTPPAGWFEEDGAAVSRTTYADLFAEIDTVWGVGDGSTTFNIPDTRGEFLRGWDNGRGVDSGRGFATAQSDELKNHIHALAAISNAAYNSGSTTLPHPNDTATFNTKSFGGSETRPRNQAVMFIIKF